MAIIPAHDNGTQRGLPVTLGPGEALELMVDVLPSRDDVGASLFSQVLLYIDTPSPPIIFNISAQVTPALVTADNQSGT